MVKSSTHTTMPLTGKSDELIVPQKRANKVALATAEHVEGRGSTERNGLTDAGVPTQCGVSTMSRLQSIRRIAAGNRSLQFTSLFQYLDYDLLNEAFYRVKRYSAAGIDGVTWQDFEQTKDERLAALVSDLRAGSYKPRAARRVFIPKEDGSQRPLSILCLTDKIVQQATVLILESIYEVDFKGFSYGFRPGRSQHGALDALYVGIKRKRVNWVLDLDIQQFFDRVNHEWLSRFLEHRIKDRRLLRLLTQWIKVGHYDESGTRLASTVGVPQGGVISPLLANVYLHYSFDLWVNQWRNRRAEGDMVIVRYADDSVLGFQRKADADHFLFELRARLKKFGLNLHDQKTKLIRFGRFARAGERKGWGKAGTFDFLGFTHSCGTKRSSEEFSLIRRTSKKKFRATMRSITDWLKTNMHLPIKAQVTWLNRVLSGHFNYFAVPTNSQQVSRLRSLVMYVWLKALKRRSQRSKVNWVKFGRFCNLVLVKSFVRHPYPNERFDVIYSK